MQRTKMLYRQHDMGGMVTGTVDALGSGLKIFGFRLEDIRHKTLWIPIDQRKPGALDLNADPMPLEKYMVGGVQVDVVLLHAVARNGFGARIAFTETAAKNLIGDDAF